MQIAYKDLKLLQSNRKDSLESSSGCLENSWVKLLLEMWLGSLDSTESKLVRHLETSQKVYQLATLRFLGSSVKIPDEQATNLVTYQCPTGLKVRNLVHLVSLYWTLEVKDS